METTNARYNSEINIELSSVLQTEKHSSLSKRYNFLDTKKVITDLSEVGWFPVQASQKRVKKEDKEGFQSHVVILANRDMEVATKETLPRLVLKNGHDGGAAIHFIAGLFEKICSNGLMVRSSSTGDIRITHTQYNEETFKLAMQSAIALLGESLETSQRMKDRPLAVSERTEFAIKAIEMAFDGEKYAVKNTDMLYNWRIRQQEPNLWNTYNTVQEHIIRGGVRQQRSDGSRIRSRAVTAIDRNIKLNRNLWQLAESFL